MTDKDILVEISCHRCKSPTSKNVYYLKQRVRKGRFKIFCSRECANKHHSEAMRGENNPNYEGTFHGVQSDKWSEEKWEEVRSKISRSMIEKGTSKGQNNGRWAGGEQEVSCVICDTKYTIRPHVYRKIKSGKQNALCGVDCMRSFVLTYGEKKDRTSIEIKMAKELDKRHIKYVEQYNLGNKFALDFFIPDHEVVIECDGRYWHEKPDVAKRDKSKNAYIKKCGYTLFRFWDDEINKDVSACVDKVIEEIEKKKASA